MRTLFIIKAIIALQLVSGCGAEDKDNAYRDVSSGQPPVEDEQLAEHNRDNFNFAEFQDVDWKSPVTFGEACNGSCIGITKSPMPDHLEMPELGITKNNYYLVSTKGDGSCWLTAATQSLLYQVFRNSDNFSHAIKTIEKYAEKLRQYSGFY